MKDVRSEKSKQSVIRVLITGSNGMIGSALMNHLQTEGFEVFGTLRNTPLSSFKEELKDGSNFNYCVVGDIHQDTDWSQALKNIDVVIHTAACVHQMQGSNDYDRVNHWASYQLAKQVA